MAFLRHCFFSPTLLFSSDVVHTSQFFSGLTPIQTPLEILTLSCQLLLGWIPGCLYSVQWVVPANPFDRSSSSSISICNPPWGHGGVYIQLEQWAKGGGRLVFQTEVSSGWSLFGGQAPEVVWLIDYIPFQWVYSRLFDLRMSSSPGS